ncbi:MAG: leucine-rich repeat protein [Pseudomonadota bacterium]
MSERVYKKIKKQNGERFARSIRDFHSGIFEVPGIEDIVKHAGRDAEPLLPYLLSLTEAANENEPAPPKAENPFKLLKEAGYDAFYANTLEKQNSIKRYFAPGELLCTFNSNSRFLSYYVVHAVKKGADKLKRSQFKGIEKRQDEYGTSVISIQILKSGGLIKITNRYNHAVDFPDNTFQSNPDHIIEGLSLALKDHFNVDFDAPSSPLPDGYLLAKGQVFQHHTEDNNIYYGHHAFVKDGIVTEIDRKAGHALFERFYFDNKTKTLRNVDPHDVDKFPLDFNRDYGGNTDLHVDKKGNLKLGDVVLIEADESKIVRMNFDQLSKLSDSSLHEMPFLKSFRSSSLQKIGHMCFDECRRLEEFSANALIHMGKQCLRTVYRLKHFEANRLLHMGRNCLLRANSLVSFHAESLQTMGKNCLNDVSALTDLVIPTIKQMNDGCIEHAESLTHFEANALKQMGKNCLNYAPKLTSFVATGLKVMKQYCIQHSPQLQECLVPERIKFARDCFEKSELISRRRSRDGAVPRAAP